MSTPGTGVESLATGRLDVGDGWQRTNPLGIIAQGLRGIRQAILPIVAILFGARSADVGPAIALAVGAVIVVLSIALTALAWWNTQYRLGSSDVRVQKGIFGRQARSVPFERIQDVSLEQGLLSRLLGLVEVRFETGAGGKDELTLAYVSAQEGEALRETVRARLEPDGDAQRVEAVGDDVTKAGEYEPAMLFSMGPRRLLLFGIFEFSLILFAVLAGLAQQFDFLLPFDLWDFDDWEQRLAGPGAWLSGLGPAARFIGALIAIGIFGIVGLATGIGRTFARDFGFRLDRTAKGFRRRRGLFTRTDVVMPAHRVQAITISTGVLRRLWGWHGLSFISLAHDASSANHTVAPFARMREIEPVVRKAGHVLPSGTTDYQRASRRYRTHRALVWLAVFISAAFGALFTNLPLIAIPLLLLGAAAAARQYFLWHHDRHALDEAQVLSRTGWLAPRLTIASRQKLHSVSIVQGPLGRMGGYAHLRLGLAGGNLSFRGIPVSEARQLRSALLSSMTKKDFSALLQS